jgi:uncharacterized protein
MKRLALIIALMFSVCAFAQISKVIPAKPNPQRLVNDFAGALTQEQVQALENKLVAYDDSTSNQIAVVTLKTTGDYEIEEVALGILRNWGVGGTKNNGIVILAAIEDHKIWIATGYGLEGAVPDITAKTIVDNDVTPNFRQGNYYRGFDEGTSSIIRAAAGEYKASEGYRNRGSSSGGLSIGKIIFAIIILIFILSSFGGNNRGGGYVSRRGSGWLGPMILGNMLGRGSGGGGFGGGFGGGGGGGFGGFGGGSGGGGGAGGSW